MEYKSVHNLNIKDIGTMIKIQKELRRELSIRKLDHTIKIVSGMDVAYYNSCGKEKAVSVIVSINMETMEVVESVHAICDVTNPYVSGYFAFKELPCFLEAWSLLKIKPDLVVFDGQGMLHPNRMGLASHASFFIDTPTIGVGKTFLHFNEVLYTPPENYLGAYSNIYEDEETLGIALRSRVDCKPVFVSVGNYITLDESIEVITKLFSKDSRIPIPTRLADIETKKLRAEILRLEGVA